MAIDRRQLADLHEAVRQWCQEHVRGESLEEFEPLAEEVSRSVGLVVMEQGMVAVGGRSSYRGSRQPCSCGKRARFVGYRRRGVGTLFGVVEVSRAYYHCGECGTGQVPWDAAQGLSSYLWTPRVKAMLSQAAARLPYAEAVELLEQWTGLRIEESGAERIVGELGGRLREQEAELMAAYCGGELLPLIPRPAQRLYVSMDGTSAHIDGAWHEVKTGVVYEGRAGVEGIDVSHESRYVAAQEPAECFGERLYLTAAQAGVEQASEVVVIGDGAEWIWNLAAYHYPQATEVVDFWHACEHIHSLARTMYGEGQLRGQRWAQRHCRQLAQQGPRGLRRALRRMRPTNAEQREALRRELG